MISSKISKNTLKADMSNNIYSYEKVSIDNLKHEYEITVSSDYIERKICFRLQEISKNVKFPGFRSGKTPYHLVFKNYKNEVLKHVVNNAIDYCSNDLIKKIEVKSHIHPKIDIVSLTDLDKESKKYNFVYRLSFEEVPEVPLINLDKISLKKFKVEIEEEDIKEFIDSIKIEFPNLISVNNDSYQAKNGDQLSIDFEGRVRNKLFQGGSGKNFTVNLGSYTFIDGFESQLIGMKKGETKSFKLKFPENYKVIFLAGQEATFFLRVNDIKIAEDFGSDNNDDEIARRIGFADYSLLRNHAKEAINDQCKEMGKILIRKDLFNFLDASYSFYLPKNLVEQEHERVKKELDSKKDPFKEAKRRVKLAMLFMKFSMEHEMSLTQNDILNVIHNLYVNKDIKNKDVQVSRILKHFSLNRQFQELVKGQALEYKITNFVIEKVKKEEQIISVKELRKLFYNFK